jgi:nucleoside-diphosphate-sugar epimerase
MASPYILLDLVETPNLVDAIQEEVSGVIHLAAAVPHSAYYPDTEQTAELTRMMDENVLTAVKSWQCPVVYMSTCGLYDRTSKEIKYEDDISNIKIESPYFAAKQAGEMLYTDWPQTMVMRLAAPIGPGQKSSVVTSRFIELARQDKPLQIWGSGNRQQNFIDVRDVEKLVASAILNPVPSLINVAGPQPVTMLELANKIVDVIGKGRVEFANQADPRDTETANYSIERAHDVFGWQPKYSLVESLCNVADIEFGA